MYRAFRYLAVFEDASSSKSGGRRLLAAARKLTPNISFHRSPQGHNGWILEITARQVAQALSRFESLGEFRIGLASTRTAALLAAQSPGLLEIPPGSERNLLSPFPVEFLSTLTTDFDDEVRLTLIQWGVQTLGELASLPGEDLAARMGDRAARLQQLACGKDLQPFQPHREEENFIERKELDWVLDSLEPLTFVLGSMLDSLCGRLGKRALSVEELKLDLGLEGGKRVQRRLRLSFPLCSAKTLLSLLRLDLQSDPPRAGIIRIILKAKTAPPRRLQYSLLQQSRPDPEELSRVLARLTALAGKDGVGRPMPLETHRPDVFRLYPFHISDEPGKRCSKSPLPLSGQPRLALRRLRPPRPLHIRREHIVQRAGPWRTSGDWWEKELHWSRDEWDLEFNDGLICRVYWDHIHREWFLEGIYD